MHTLYTPEASIKFQHMGDLDLLVRLDVIKTYLVSNITTAYPGARGGEQGIGEDFVNLTLTFTSDNSFVFDSEKLYQNIVKWARRSRLNGLRGDRLCVVSDIVMSHNTACVFY